MSDTPSSRIVAQASQGWTVSDARGREIGVRRLGRAEIRRLMRAWGQASDIDRWLGEAVIAAHVTSIDGTPVAPSRTPDQIDNLVERLGDDGMLVVAESITPQQNEADLRAAGKN